MSPSMNFTPFCTSASASDFEGLDRIVIALGFEVVGQFASRKIGIAVANEDEISVETAVAVERAGGFDGGAEFVIGADQRQRGGGGEELGVRSGREKLVGVLRVQRLARFCVGVRVKRLRFPRSRGQDRES